MLTAVGPANLPFRLADALGDVDAEEMDEREEEEVLLLEEYPKSWLDIAWSGDSYEQPS